MAVVYPGASYRQLPSKSVTPLGPRIINVHTMVWDLDNCENYFARPGNPYSHFGTGPNGEVRQWQDLQFRAASDLNGNPFCIAIENADKGAGYPAWTGSDVPRFTPPQAEANAQLIAWLCTRFGIPPNMVPDSLPGRVGPGYHRHGIDPWRVYGGVLYSSSYAKVCPGDRRIAQMSDEIMPRVRQIIATSIPPTEDGHMPYPCFHSSEENRYRFAVTCSGPVDIPDDTYYGVLVYYGIIKESVGVLNWHYEAIKNWAALCPGVAWDTKITDLVNNSTLEARNILSWAHFEAYTAARQTEPAEEPAPPPS